MFKQRKENLFTSFIKRRTGKFHVAVVQWTSKKCTKNPDPLAELLFSSKTNRPFYRYGGHIELIRFKEYYRMPRRA